LVTGQRGKLKYLRILLYFGDLGSLFSKYGNFRRKKIPRNLVSLTQFFSQKCHTGFSFVPSGENLPPKKKKEKRKNVGTFTFLGVKFVMWLKW
jgi:hypothetical protein